MTAEQTLLGYRVERLEVPPDADEALFVAHYLLHGPRATYRLLPCAPDGKPNGILWVMNSRGWVGKVKGYAYFAETPEGLRPARCVAGALIVER